MARRYWYFSGVIAALAACSDADAPPANGDSPSEQNANPLLGASAEQPPIDPAFAVFVDPDTGLSLQDVRDADREIVRFQLEQRAMVAAASGDAVSGWAADDNELRWERGGRFRVRFGTEAGQRRAYFTETGPGTICNLTIRGPDQLSISPTNEEPPGS